MTSSEEWKRAKEWIQSTNIIPMNGKAFEKSDDLFDFAQSLRDGVILCQVANKLKPGSVKEISTVTNIQLHTFLCLKNIRSFLGACRHIFKLEADKLFEAHDLYDVTDFHPVINTISLLSKTPEAVRTCKLTPFSPREEAEVNEVEKESIYGTLPEILEKKAAPDYYSYDHEESIYDHVGPTEEKIYDSLVSTTKSKEWFTEATDKRGHVINEILETEVRYLEALKTMIKTYIKELKGHMKSEEKEAIFMNTEKLYELHVNFNRELTTGKSSTKVKINLKVFTTYKERLLIYAHYCTNLPEAQRLVLEFSKDAAFRERVENCNRIADRKFPLQEQLVVPFQRILKYPLLLRDLNKHTPEGHAQKNDVMQAFDAVDDIARYINEYKRDAEMVKMIQQIENSVKLDTYSSLGKLSQYGRKIKDGDLQIKFITNDKKVVKRYAFLLEHCLLLCRVRGETYEVKEFYNLQKFKVEDIPPVGRGKFSQGWSLQSIKKDVVCEAKTCSMFAKTQAEKIVWVSDIAKCIEAVSLRDLHGKLGNHNFELATLEAPQNCSACQRLLRGQISQGYKCSSGCNTLLHKECLSNRPELCSTSISSSSSFCHHPTSSPNQQQLNDSRTRYTSSSTIQRPLSPDSQNISNLKAYPWYAGLMSRDGAAQLLSTHSDGSFLVRKSMNQPGLALSIRHKNETKHIKIAHLNNRYYLTDAVQFTSIVELINYYKGNSLGQSFPTLPTTLMKAVTQKGKRVMTAKYTWQARTEQELSFQVGQKITTTTDDTKWWYGECGGREGYFPSNYVE